MKSFLLTATSFLLIILVLNAGYYGDWFRAKPVQYWNDFQNEKDDTLNYDARRAARYGVNYTISMKVKEFLDKRRITNAVILFEPNSYYRDSLHINIRVPEPAVFYYYTGLRSVWTNSAEVNKANFMVRISKKGVQMDPIKSPGQLQQILATYSHFTPIL